MSCKAHSMVVFLVAVCAPALSVCAQSHDFFAHAPRLELAQTEKLLELGIVKPKLFGPAHGAEGSSLYVFGLSKLTEIRLADGRVRDYAIDFDRQSRVLYDAGVRTAWLGPDGRIYFAMYGPVARLGRFDPATGKVANLGELGGRSAIRMIWSPDNKGYVVTYPANISEVDTATGTVRNFGRLAHDALYIHGEIWFADNHLYCSPGQRPQRKASIDLATGKVTLLDKFPDVEHIQPTEVDTDDLFKKYKPQISVTGNTATVTLANPGDETCPRKVQFTCSTVARDILLMRAGPDGKIYCTGSYRQAVYDPATGKIVRPVYHLSIYDFLAVGDKMLFSGYPNARIGQIDTTRPFATHPAEVLWVMKDPKYNPREVLNIYQIDAPEEVHTKGKLAMKRAWTMAPGADGRVYIGCTGSRQNWGGALVTMDPETFQTTYLRKPFRFLGINEMCAMDGGARIGIVTAVSPDPIAPGAEPAAAKVMVYDVAAGKIVHQGVPMDDCKILTSVIQAPGRNMLIGLGLRGVQPKPVADNHYAGNGELFFYDLRAGRTVKRIAFDFPLRRNRGRAIAAAPDGSLWVSGGGGIIRVDPATLTAEPLARIGQSGNMLLVGNRLYLDGAMRLRWADVSSLLH